MHDTGETGKKRILILLGLVMLLGYCAVFALIWFLMTNSSEAVHQFFITAIVALFVCSVIGLGLGMAFLVIGLLSKSGSPFIQKISRGIVDLFYPMTMWLGRLVGVSKQEIEDSYIKINNQMTTAQDEKYRPDEVLVLAPLCLQNSDCPYKITEDVSNCRRCGKCPVSDLLEVADETGVNFVVASGGTFARRFATQYHPKAIVAIACEKDLTSGIKDMHAKHIPVVGVLNERPHGQCHNTIVSICKVRQAIGYFTQE